MCALSACTISIENDNSANQEEATRNWVYCTPEDQSKDIKTYIRDDDTLCVKGFLNVGKYKLMVKQTSDGVKEFALVTYGSGRNRVAKAQIYSITQNANLRYYGTGTYFKELGGYVKFGCPDCSSLNPEACKKCY